MAVVHYKDLRDLLEQTSKKYSDEIAFKIKYKDEIIGIKYSKFIEDIRGFGSYLTTLDLDKKRIAFISKNRYEWCVTYFAVATSNMIAVPIDKALTLVELKSLIDRAEAEVLIFESKYEAEVEVIKNDPNTTVKHFINMDTDLNEIIIKGKNLLKRENNKYNKIKIENDKMKFMLFTSGTTSTSKCVMLSHKNICSNIEDIDRALNVNKDDTLLSLLPAHHTFECTAGFLFPVSVGAKIAFCEGIRHITNNMKEFEVTAMISVPLLYESMYKKIWKQISEGKKETQVKVALKASETLLKVGIDLRKQLFKQIHEALGGHMRLMVSGAAAIDPNVSKGFNDFGFTMYQGYGLTETSPVLSVERLDYTRLSSVGIPLERAEIKIDKPDQDGIGEIIVKAPYVMLGYYNDEEATKNVLSKNWLYTGDLGRMDKDGFLFITGRKKDVIVLKNGKNIYPEEIEVLINRLDYVAESFVYGIRDSEGDIEIRAKIVYDIDEVVEKFGTIDDKALKEYFWNKIKELNKEMPTYKYVKNIIITDEELIKTTTKKIKRHEEIKKV